MNNPIHYENHKWEIIEKFRGSFDMNARNFHKMLENVGRETGYLFDSSRYQPFAALTAFSKKEPEIVRKMFRSLFKADGGDLSVRQRKILAFVHDSERLRIKYMPENPWYVNDQRSAMAFLFFHDPKSNYMYKGAQAREFADCIEFRHDWHTGIDFKLDVYYRMCDALVKQIKMDRSLLGANEKRFSLSGESTYKDENYHLLAFDIIYCSTIYDLFEGISYVKANIKTRHLIHEKKKKAKELYAELLSVEATLKKLEDAKDYFDPLFTVGRKVRHKVFGEGTIRKIDGTSAIIFFPNKNTEKKFGILTSAAGGFITIDVPDYDEKAKQYKKVILREGEIAQRLSYARRRMAPYTKYLD